MKITPAIGATITDAAAAAAAAAGTTVDAAARRRDDIRITRNRNRSWICRRLLIYWHPMTT